MANGRRLLFIGLCLLGMLTRSRAADLYTPGTLIVKLAPSSSLSALNDDIVRALPSLQKNAALPLTIQPVFSSPKARLNRQTGITDFSPGRYFILHFATEADAQTIHESLQHASSVEFVQRNYLYRIDAMPNDSAAASQWNLQRIGINRLWNEGFFSTVRPLIKVGVLDTGVDYHHPDLSPAIAINAGETGIDAQGRDKRTNGIDDDGNGFVDDWHGYDFVESDPRGNDPADDNGHGTSVAGIIGAVANNGLGVAGIAPCALMPVRAFDASGNGTDADIAAGIIYAVDNGCSVINMSFGVTVLTPMMRDAVRYAASNNVVMIASSGNDGNDKPHYPSDLDGVIAVGSVSLYDSRSSFSSFGPPLALVAPGENIVTTALGGGYTSTFSGTSAAAPNVTGVTALVKSVIAADPTLGSVPFSNEEFRTLLANSADDIGKPGWDAEYGAGVVDASNAVHTLTHNAVTISSPSIDAILTGGRVAVKGTAVFSGMKTLDVSIGAGENPTGWTPIAQYENRYFFGDTIGVWNTDGYGDGIYTIRLAAGSVAGSDVEQRVRVILRRAAPVITQLIADDSVVIADELGAMIRLDVDRPAVASLWFRQTGSAGAFIEKRAEGLQKHHYFLLTSLDATPGVPYEYYCTVTDNAGQKAAAPGLITSPGGLPTVTIGAVRIPTTGFNMLSYTLPSGYLLNAVGSFASKPTIIMDQYDAANEFSRLKSFQFANGAFTAGDTLARPWVPRDLGNVNGDGVLASLVQDRGVTKVIGSDAASNRVFARDLFGDSTDVWGSQFYDFDHDGKMDIVARSSTEYLIYRNLGNNHFAVAARLPDPTAPLPGEAANQFGPPRSIVGNFTGLGKTEIVFADYDGDLIMYRQSDNDPFAFTLAWTDTSSLYETSDYLAAGDFDGDGVMEIVSAGHSNLDLNADREYDAPFWTVRIFSHAPSAGTMTKAWEKKFVGVRAGFQNDNGVTTAKIMPGREQALLTLNPYFYIIRYDSLSRIYTPAWIHDGQSNAALVYDFNNNGTSEFGINADGAVRFFEYQSTPSALQSPWGLTAEQRSEHSIRLRWNSMTPAGDHAVYRDTVLNRLSHRSIVHGTELTDSTVTPGVKYFYTVAALTPVEGNRSDPLTITPEHTPHIITVDSVSASQMRITFSFEPDRSRFPSAFIAADDTIIARSIVSASSVSILATFDPALGAGTHVLAARRIYASSGFETDTAQRITVKIQAAPVQAFGIVEAMLDGEKAVRLRFNSRITVSSLVKSNFTVRTSAGAFSINDPAFDGTDSTIVVLRISAGSLTALGLRIEVVASSDVTSASGSRLNEGKGQTVSFGINTLTLAHPVVFPNPLRYLVGLQEKISFVNIPVRCRVSIFTAAGRKVREQADLSTPDGLTWDLRDDQGDVVASGIYLYRMVRLDENGAIIESTMGKFAIIR